MSFLQNCASNLSACVRSLLFLILAGHAELVQLQVAIYQSIHRKAHCLCGYMIPTNRQLRFPAVACTLKASMLGPWPNVSTCTEFNSCVHPVSSGMAFSLRCSCIFGCCWIVASAWFRACRAQPRTRRYMIMSVLMNMRGTGCVSAGIFVC
jgi:hypothetical protein